MLFGFGPYPSNARVAMSPSGRADPIRPDYVLCVPLSRSDATAPIVLDGRCSGYALLTTQGGSIAKRAPVSKPRTRTHVRMPPLALRQPMESARRFDRQDPPARSSTASELVDQAPVLGPVAISLRLQAPPGRAARPPRSRIEQRHPASPSSGGTSSVSASAGACSPKTCSSAVSRSGAISTLSA